jgi:hypothetical protein
MKTQNVSTNNSFEDQIKTAVASCLAEIEYYYSQIANFSENYYLVVQFNTKNWQISCAYFQNSRHYGIFAKSSKRRIYIKIFNIYIPIENLV